MLSGAMPHLHPAIEPFRSGCLAVGDGHAIHWEECGNPAGAPAVVLHGGPGSGVSPTPRRYFDPAYWRVVLFDQRGCGRSTPHAGRDPAALDANTTADLIADIEALRIHLGISHWLVFGSSWGATLALAYAVRHAARVRALVLAAVTTTSAAEVDWFTRGVGRHLPDAWSAFRDHVPTHLRDGNLAAAYRRLLTDPDPVVHHAAARAWCAWEDAVAGRPSARFADPVFALGFARLVTHYWANAGFLADGELLATISGLAGTPATLIHGRNDLGSPLTIAGAVHRAWPGSELVVLDGAGHDRADMEGAILAAIAAYAMPHTSPSPLAGEGRGGG